MDLDRLAPIITRLVDPECDFHVIDVDEIRQAITVYVAKQDALRIISPRKTRPASILGLAASHRHPLPPVAVAEVWPILDNTVIDQDDVLEAVTRHVGPLHTRIREVDIWKTTELFARKARRFLPALQGIIKIILKPRAGTDS